MTSCQAKAEVPNPCKWLEINAICGKDATREAGLGAGGSNPSAPTKSLYFNYLRMWFTRPNQKSAGWPAVSKLFDNDHETRRHTHSHSIDEC